VPCFRWHIQWLSERDSFSFGTVSVEHLIDAAWLAIVFVFEFVLVSGGLQAS
jgi:hypothetical protein